MRRALLSVLVSVLLACGGGDGADGKPTGPLGATGPSQVAPIDSLSFAASGVCSVATASGQVDVGMSTVAVASADVSGLCTMTLASQARAGMRTITLMVIRAVMGAPPGVPPGKYPITQDPTGTTVVQLAAAAVDRSDAACASTSVEATSGTLWLDVVTAGRVSGAVDATLADGTHLAGTFDAPACALTFPIEALCAGTWVPPAGTCLP